jgi:hypothetical protein
VQQILVGIYWHYFEDPFPGLLCSERKHNQQRIPKSQNEAQHNLRSFTGDNGCSNTNIAILQKSLFQT